MLKATIIIPNYNGIKYIRTCLDSLAGQLKESEVLIIDNASQDGSYQVIQKEYPWAKCIQLSENTGFCHAVNVGIQSCHTPYFILLNNDTKVFPGFVQALIKAIERKESIFSVSAKMLMWDKPNIIDDAGDRYCALGWAFSRGKGKATEKYKHRTEIFAACGGAAIYRREILEEIGYFDETHFAYLEDIDIGYRAKIYGYSNYYEPSAKVLHAGSASSGSRYNAFKTKLASANSIYLIGKNMPVLQWVWNFPLLFFGFVIKWIFFTRKKMGFLYLKGLYNGLKRCCSVEGKRHKVPFQWKHFSHYITIQLQLYMNLFRLFVKK